MIYKKYTFKKRLKAQQEKWENTKVKVLNKLNKRQKVYLQDRLQTSRWKCKKVINKKHIVVQWLNRFWFNLLLSVSGHNFAMVSKLVIAPCMFFLRCLCRVLCCVSPHHTSHLFHLTHLFTGFQHPSSEYLYSLWWSEVKYPQWRMPNCGPFLLV